MPPRTAMSGAPAATPERRPTNLMATAATSTTAPIVPVRGGVWLLVGARPCPVVASGGAA